MRRLCEDNSAWRYIAQSRRMVRQSLYVRLRTSFGAAFDGERCRFTTDIGANGSALPRLLECDMCAAEVVLRAGKQCVDTSYELLLYNIECMNSYWPVRPALSSARRLRSVSPSLCLCLIKALNRLAWVRFTGRGSQVRNNMGMAREGGKRSILFTLC